MGKSAEFASTTRKLGNARMSVIARMSIPGERVTDQPPLLRAGINPVEDRPPPRARARARVRARTRRMSHVAFTRMARVSWATNAPTRTVLTPMLLRQREAVPLPQEGTGKRTARAAPLSASHTLRIVAMAFRINGFPIRRSRVDPGGKL